MRHLNNEETLKAASANNLAYALNTLHQMERLERDQSTNNTSVLADIAALRGVDKPVDI